MTACARCKRQLKNPASVQHGMGPVCFARSQAGVRDRQLAPASAYEVVRVDDARCIVWIVDLDTLGARSVTNDAEAVVQALHAQYHGFRVIYRDSMGNWDELVHAQGRFMDYRPARDMAPGGLV
jgi:hypothetical protein